MNDYKNLPADYLLAAQQGDIDKVKTCLALGVDINTCDRQGKTAITLASLYQQYACVQALMMPEQILISKIKYVQILFN